MSLKKYKLSHLPVSLLETARRALLFIWPEQVAIIWAQFEREKNFWISELLVNLCCKLGVGDNCFESMLVLISVVMDESVLSAPGSGEILVQIELIHEELENERAEVFLWKFPRDLRGKSAPVDACEGPILVLEYERECLEKMRTIVQERFEK